MKSLLLSTLLLSACMAVKAEPEKLNLDIDSITVSGLSSGGYMANQFHIAHSDWVTGAGIIAAGPYYCAQNDIAVALAQCVNKSDPEISLQSLQSSIDEMQNKAKIAPLSNVKNSKVWLFHGRLDSRIISAVSDALYQQYKRWVDSDNIKYINDKAMAHLFPTQDYGTACDKAESPFIGNCGYDAAGEMLTHLLGNLIPKTTEPQGKLLSIDQKELGKEPASSLADEGFVYVPQTCQQGEVCQVHVSFHGCNQNAQTVGKEYALNNGINRWADSNHLVVLYPQTKTSMFMPLNPQGCWDWWGYTDSNYANRDGQQIQAIKNIISNLKK